MIVVADIGPLNYLVLIEAVDVLQPLYKHYQSLDRRQLRLGDGMTRRPFTRKGYPPRQSCQG